MTIKEQFDIAQTLKSLREEKQNRLNRIAEEQVLVDECELKISGIYNSLTAEDVIVINQLVG